MFGGYKCVVDMDIIGITSMLDVYFDVSESTARKLNKEKRIVFTGTVEGR